MAFVNAVRGNNKIKVSRKTYEKIFRNKGYEIIEEEHKKEEHVEEKKHEKQEKHEEMDIPISDMNKEQLMKFAEENKIDTSNIKSFREAKSYVQKVVRERHKK